MELVKVDATYDPIITLSLNRPEKRNALNIDLMSQLCAALEKIRLNSKARVVIIRGEGAVFCAGLDLLEAQDPQKSESSSHYIAAMLKAVYYCPCPTIALVQGAAFAGGLGLMAGCDFVIAEDKAVFGLPELRRGLVAAQIMPLLLRKMSLRDLKVMLFFEEKIHAQNALQIGLVNRVVSQENLMSEAFFYAERVLCGAPEATKRTKELLEDLFPTSFAESQNILVEFHRQIRESEEAKEGIAAFLEKTQSYLDVIVKIANARFPAAQSKSANEA